MNPSSHQRKERGILVIHPGAVGDVLMTRPSLSLIRCRFPQHEIALLVWSTCMALAGKREMIGIPSRIDLFGRIR